MKDLLERLGKVQAELKAPKNQYNAFGKYKYRSCEDVLEAVKPLLVKHGLTMVISDDIRGGADTFGNGDTGVVFVQSTVVVYHETHSIKVSASAGIDFSKKGQDMSQRFGTSGSYARKYALNGMFLIDDTKDADATNTHGKTEVTKTATKQKLTDDIKSKMSKAVSEGKTKAVIKRLEAYEYTEDDIKSIMNPQL